MAKHKFQGRERIAKTFRQMPEVARKELKKSLERSAKELVAAQKALVPVDTGGLRDSITWTDDPAKIPSYAAFQQKGIVRDKELSVFVTAGNTKVRTAHLVEFGTAPHVNAGLFPGTQHPGTEPQPFFLPAYRIMRRRIANRATRAVRQAIKKATGQ